MSLQHAAFAAASSAVPVGTIATIVVAAGLALAAIGLYLRHVHTSTQLTRTRVLGAVVGACAVAAAAAFAMTVSLSASVPAPGETPHDSPILEETEAVEPSDGPGIQLPTLPLE